MLTTIKGKYSEKGLPGYVHYNTDIYDLAFLFINTRTQIIYSYILLL